MTAARLKLVCLAVVLVGCTAAALGGRTDLSVMVALLGVGLFVGLGLVPMGSLAAGQRLPVGFAALLVVQAVAIAGFALLQPVDAGLRAGSRVGLLGLLGHGSVGSASTYQLLALAALVVAIGCCCASFVALRRMVHQPGWVRPPARPIGFYAEGRDPREP